MSTIATNLHDAVNSAIEKIPALPITEDAAATEAEKPTEEVEKVAEVPKKDDETSLGLDEAELLQAKQLFAALKDPAKASVVIKYLAENAGYSKAEVKKVLETSSKDEIVTILQESLGEEFGFLSEKLAPAIDKIVDSKLKKGTEDIREAMAKREEEKLLQESATAMTDIATRFFNAKEIPEDVASAMSKEMTRISPTEEMSVTEYLENIYYIVAGKKGLSIVSKKETPIPKPRSVPDRISGKTTPAPGDVIPIKMSINDAINAALETVDKAK